MRSDVSPYKDMLKEIENQEKEQLENNEVVNEPEQEERSKKRKKGKWIRSKFKIT